MIGISPGYDCGLSPKEQIEYDEYIRRYIIEKAKKDKEQERIDAMKFILITERSVKSQKDGAHIVNYSGVLTDEMGARKAVAGSFGCSCIESIPTEIEHDLRRKLGYRGFTVDHGKWALPAEPIRRGPGRPPNPVQQMG